MLIRARPEGIIERAEALYLMAIDDGPARLLEWSGTLEAQLMTASNPAAVAAARQSASTLATVRIDPPMPGVR